MTENKLAEMTALNEKIKSGKKILENLQKPNHSILISKWNFGWQSSMVLPDEMQDAIKGFAIAKMSDYLARLEQDFNAL